MTNDQNAVRGRHLDSLAADAKRYVLEEILGREIVDEFDVAVNLQETARRRSKALASMRKNSRQ